MFVRKKIKTNNAPKPIGHYSQAIRHGNFIFISGQIHLTPDGKLLGGSIEKKTGRIMNNLNAILKESGADFSNVVKTTIYLTDMKDFARVNKVYGSFMEEPFPARETVGVRELPGGASIEISMIAVKA